MLKAQGGTALGVMEDLPYFDGELALEQGDALLLYTDGVNEATDADDELYGEERLVEFLRRHVGESAETLNQALLADIREFVGEAAQSDDITSLVVRRVAH